MAFLPVTALPLAPRTYPTKLPQAPHRLQPRHAVYPRPARMCTPPDPSEEVSVPLTSLNNLTKPPSPVADPISPDPPTAAAGQTVSDDREDLRSEKQKEIERLRAAEKFIAVDEGDFECTACGYVYEEKKGVRSAGIPPNVPFDQLPDSFACPMCRSPKNRFVSKKKVIAGFAENQGYGFGSNALTGGEKSALIFGGLFLCFLLLLSGYALN